jgi:2-polyprenyl-3-methyl-5-hydroxy-6-metoxy-1,4-benzoquinol methylase
MKEERHNYEYDFDPSSETAPANVVRMVGKNKRVLEIGCGPGSITKVLAQQENCQITGLELDLEAIKIVTPYCVHVMQADLNSSDWPNLVNDIENFDVIVAADVLEHLYDPWKALQRMVPLINANGYIVISLPHVGHAAVMSCLINGDFEYRDWGLLDRTHIRFFGLKNIEALFTQANLKIIEVKYVTTQPEETEFAASWSKLSSSLQDTLMNCKDSEVYQVVVKAVPIHYAGDAVSLVAPEHKYRRTLIVTNFVSWKTRLGQYLSPERKQSIRKGLNLLGIKI